jgi:hypothetical protein
LPPIDLLLRNHDGRGEAFGASVTARSSDGGVFQGRAQDSVHVFAGNGPGTYQVNVSKPFYRDTTIANVVVAAGMCGSAIPTMLPVTLALVPGAPHVRSVEVLGATFLPTSGSRVTLVPYVDADNGFSTAVTWTLSDTTLARIDAGGTATAKCSLHGGADTVTATLVADSSIRGQAILGIGTAASCP